MNENKNNVRLAQSASALGAGILGFGLGAKWGSALAGYAFIVIIAGAIFHVWGMYIIQMSKGNGRTNNVTKALWVSAWICLIVLIAVIIYLMID